MTHGNTESGGGALGLEDGEDGQLVGRDPREMALAELAEMGHHAKPLTNAIRQKCLDCAESVSAVRTCQFQRCPSFPYRLGGHPFHGKHTLTDSERAECAGHDKMPLRKVIRRFCLECCNGNQAEARKCTATGCVFWPYRMGTNPWLAKNGNAA